MGLDSNGTKFLFAAHAAGVSFRQTAMLGRQNFFPEPAQLQRLLDLRQTGLSAVEFLADSHSYAEKFLAFLGAEEAVAIDNSAYEGAAIVTDMNAPIDASLKNRFNVVLDGGCLEHIFNFPQAIRNCMEMLADRRPFSRHHSGQQFLRARFLPVQPGAILPHLHRGERLRPPRRSDDGRKHLVSRAGSRPVRWPGGTAKQPADVSLRHGEKNCSPRTLSSRRRSRVTTRGRGRARRMPRSHPVDRSDETSRTPARAGAGFTASARRQPSDWSSLLLLPAPR